MGGPTALEVKDLAVSYGGFAALTGVSFAVPSGGIVAMIGPNGAGKTTCFNAICGHVRPTAGEVTVGGVRLPARHRPQDAWAAGIGRTFQRLELFWTLTVREHLALAADYGRRQHGESAVPDPDEVLRLLDIDDVGHVRPTRLSLGTNRLVEIGRAMCTGGRVILLDESSSGLDREETGRLERVLRDVHDRAGQTFLLIEHDMEFVMALAQWIHVLDFGRLIAQGTPEQVQADARVHEVYFGSAPTPAVPARGARKAATSRSREPTR